jgi:hypothetical protein
VVPIHQWPIGPTSASDETLQPVLSRLAFIRQQRYHAVHVIVASHYTPAVHHGNHAGFIPSHQSVKEYQTPMPEAHAHAATPHEQHLFTSSAKG